MSLQPSPENAAQIAELLLPFVLSNYGYTLDYSPASLGQLDGIVDDLRRDQRFEQLQPLLFSMGCYVGEVFVRSEQGRWRTAESMGLPALSSSPVMIELRDGRGCNPVGRVYKRFRKGREEDLAWFYRALTEGAPEPATSENEE